MRKSVRDRLLADIAVRPDETQETRNARLRLLHETLKPPLRKKDSMTSIHVSCDLETWAAGPAAIPIAIGAVRFDPTKDPSGPGATRWDKFYIAIEPNSARLLGLHVDTDTLLWWMAPERRDALDHWLKQPKVTLSEALDGFAEWYGEESLPTWTKGPAFDSVILDTAYRVCRLKKPWHFRHDRDFRSIRGLMPVSWKAPGMPETLAHDALGDAERQTFELLSVAQALGLTLS